MTRAKRKANILVVGPNKSGKTTLLETLSMTPLKEIEHHSGELVESNHPDCVEYGAFLTKELEVELRSLPFRNTEQFDMPDFSWMTCKKGVDAVMTLIPADSPQSLLSAREMLNRFQQSYSGPLVLALTHTDKGFSWEKQEVARFFEIAEDDVIFLDPRDYTDSLSALNYLFEYIPLPSTPVTRRVASRQLQFAS
jgi:signal recognition particle receptor subunit beta